MKAFSILVLLMSLFLVACGGGSSGSEDSDPDDIVKEAKSVTITILEVSGVSLESKATINYVLNQDSTVNSLENPIGQFTSQFNTSPVSGNNDLKIMIQADGYVDTGTTVQLNDDQSAYSTKVLLVKDQAGKVKDGIYTHVEDGLTGIDSNGIATEEIEIVLEDEEDSSSPMLMVTIPQGTQMTDESGDPVLATTATIVRFDPTEENVLDAYPGGLNVQADIGGGVMEQIDFKSAGFASIVLKDDAGNKVKSFEDNEITIAMQFKEGTTDGDGKVVLVGGTVPIWSYNEDKGTWVSEGADGDVVDLDDTDGLLDVVYSTDHLTYFNLDWKTSEVCDARIELRDNANVVQNNILKVDLKINDYNIHQSFVYDGDGFIDFLNLPVSSDWEIQFLDPVTNEVIDTETGTANLCGDRTVSVDLPSIGDLPVTSTEIGVNLYCGTNLQQTADVFIQDENNFLRDYGLSINQPFDLRTGNDGVLNIYDLPRSFVDKVLNVNVFASSVDRELVQLAIDNTPGTFPITIGKDRSENEIKLLLPDSYCEAGSFSESVITATVSCPTGIIPNTELQTMDFAGKVEANLSPADASAELISENFINGQATLDTLLTGSDYSLTLTPFDPTIAQYITNNSEAVVITAGDNKAYDFFLTEEYCNAEVENTTYTYTDEDGFTVIETPIINSTGAYDLSEYLPSQSAQLEYRNYYLSSSGTSEDVSTETANITVVGNKITEKDDDNDKTEFIIESDKIQISSFYENENGEIEETRDAVLGRLYDVGEQIYLRETVGSSEDTVGSTTIISETDFEERCSLDDAPSSYTKKGISYSGDIIKLKCEFSGTVKITVTGSPETTYVSNKTEYIYLKKNVGEIASISDSCVPEGEFLPNNTPGCTVNEYDYRLLIE